MMAAGFERHVGGRADQSIGVPTQSRVLQCGPLGMRLAEARVKTFSQQHIFAGAVHWGDQHTAHQRIGFCTSLSVSG